AEIEFPFFEKYLKDARHSAPAEANVFETGSNTWRTFDHWPPSNVSVKTLFARERGKLAYEPPPESTKDSLDEFVSDPAKPVPYTEAITSRMTNEYMVEDQRFAARRPDVMFYQTEALDADLVVAGPLEVDLWVTTTGTDADFIVKLIDVQPDGTTAASLPNYQMMIRSEVIRGRFRDSFEHPAPFQSGVPTKVHLELLDVLHRFKKGHRLMIQVQSTWFPLIDRNPQKFVENIYLAKPEDFIKATHRILRSATHPTNVRMSVLP
ncbi:MAG TPA: CocE/NonD family hydrolase, partial [Pirellula sp.]|nr:CocE/NonD family hydrolase [Pirellula sp.]